MWYNIGYVKSQVSGKILGQYFDDDGSLVRNVVLKLSEDLTKNVKPQPILDAVLTNHECKVLTDILIDTKECRYIYCY